jgi:hypothetical protein
MYLIPTPAGTLYAVGSSRNDPQRTLLWSLLHDTSSQQSTLDHLVEISGIADRKNVGQMMFKLQREGWLTSEDKPIVVHQEPIQSALESQLASLAGSGQAVLSDEPGLRIAHTGFQREVADRLSILGAELLANANPARINPAWDDEEDGYWQVSGRWGNTNATFVRLCVGTHRFMLAAGDKPRLDSMAFTRLVALLGRRYFRGQYPCLAMNH